MEAGLKRIETAVAEAGSALARARSGDDGQAAEVAAVRDAAERTVKEARRVEGVLDRGRQDSLRSSVEAQAEIVAAMGELCEAVADARDAAGERATALEGSMLGESTGDDVADELRACSRAEAELQAGLRGTGESVTEAEVRAAHLRDRRDETMAELERIAARLERELEAAARRCRRTSARRSSASSSGWGAGASSSGRSTRWPSASTRRRSLTSPSSRNSAPTWRPRSASWRG